MIWFGFWISVHTTDFQRLGFCCFVRMQTMTMTIRWRTWFERLFFYRDPSSRLEWFSCSKQWSLTFWLAHKIKLLSSAPLCRYIYLLIFSLLFVDYFRSLAFFRPMGIWCAFFSLSRFLSRCFIKNISTKWANHPRHKSSAPCFFFIQNL